MIRSEGGYNIKNKSCYPNESEKIYKEFSEKVFFNQNRAILWYGLKRIISGYRQAIPLIKDEKIKNLAISHLSLAKDSLKSLESISNIA